MRATIKALLALLASAGWQAYYGDATGADSYPYVLLWGTPGSDDVEPTLADDDAWSDLLGVTVVDDTALNTVGSAQQVRDLLDGLVVPVDSRHVQVHLRRSLGQTVQPDRDVTIPGTNTHPCFMVDRYLLVSQHVPF